LLHTNPVIQPQHGHSFKNSHRYWSTTPLFYIEKMVLRICSATFYHYSKLYPWNGCLRRVTALL